MDDSVAQKYTSAGIFGVMGVLAVAGMCRHRMTRTQIFEQNAEDDRQLARQVAQEQEIRNRVRYGQLGSPFAERRVQNPLRVSRNHY